MQQRRTVEGVQHEMGFYLQLLIYSQMWHVSWSFPGCYLRYLAPTWLLGKLIALNRATSTLLE